jgi:hypothetical protein
VASFAGRRARAALIAVTLAICAIAVICCGGSDDSGGGGDARAQFDRAVGPDGLGKLDSGNLDLSVKVDVDNGDQSGSFSLGLTGPFQSGKDGGVDLRLTADSSYPGSEGNFEIGLVSAKQNLYIEYGGDTFELGTAQLKRLGAANGSRPSGELGFKEACRMQLRASGGDPSVCDQLRPSSWLGGFSDEGEEEVGGVQTTHLQGDIDVRNLMLDLIRIGKSIVAARGVPLGGFDPGRIADEAEKYIDKAEVNAYPATSDGIPRKLGLDLSIDAGSAGGVDLTADVTFEHVNEPQTIAPPPGPIQPIGALAQRLPPPFGQLLDCLLRAKSQADLQACGAGVGGLGATGSAGTTSLD